MEITTLKIVGILTSSIVVANIILFAFRVISVTIFWSIIVITAIIAYIVVPAIKKYQLLDVKYAHKK